MPKKNCRNCKNKTVKAPNGVYVGPSKHLRKTSLGQRSTTEPAPAPTVEEVPDVPTLTESDETTEPQTLSGLGWTKTAEPEATE